MTLAMHSQRFLAPWQALQQRPWRQVCALGLSTTYGSLLLLISLCFATEFLHVEAPHAHRYGQSHDHADHSSSIPFDICDAVLQALQTSALRIEPPALTMLRPGEFLAVVSPPLRALKAFTLHTIRAPPVSLP